MPTLYELADTFRAALLQNDAAASLRLVQAYGTVESVLVAGLADIERLIEEAKAQGIEPTRYWLVRQDRFQQLLTQVQEQTGRFALVAERDVTFTQAQAVNMAQLHAEGLTRAAIADAGPKARVTTAWNRLPTGAFDNLVGYLQDGSPLSTLLRGIGDKAASGAQEDKKAGMAANTVKAVSDELLRGLALGRNPRVTARKVRDAAGISLTRAQTISRTETLRSYRQSSIQSYAENSDVISGWRWLAALSPRTCPLCIALHGKIFPVDKPFGSHPNCRCTPVPVIIGQEDDPFETGPEWFAKREESYQQGILGKEATAQYRAGRVSLPDFVGEKNSDKWGLTRYVRALKDVL